MKPKSIALYLHVHQPFRLRPYTVFDTATAHNYFSAEDSDKNREIFEKVAEKSYRPMNQLLERLLQEHPAFRCSLSITGTFIEQAEAWAPDVLESFRRLVGTGRMEIVAETYHHSLAFFYSRTEFEAQVQQHQTKIQELFGVRPSVFRNTELAYNNQLGQWAEQAGYKGVIAEGWDPVLGVRSPNYVYRPAQTKAISLLLKNYRLSDDLAFRFSDTAWQEWPLTAEKYVAWADASDAQTINLFMDYETFGEHQWQDTGVFSFFADFASQWLASPERTFRTLSETISAYPPVDEVDMPNTVTWADTERDLSAWLGNAMQQEALKYLYNLEEDILRSGDDGLIDDWRRLQTSDHVYYMCTKWFKDGDVHAYFSPYESPYEAFIYFMNTLRDLRWRIMEHRKGGLQWLDQ
ncbi:MAG TPA: glycoside hydrolase family 57 protein [Verrucomicrobiae bacterium]|nr:glycoside hydrolase family 57 protein [Verrucomicrobiae bacterium]